MRFWKKIAFGSLCWEWTGSRNGRNGYGYFNDGHGRIRTAHRLIYEAMTAPIPQGLTIDHLCRNRACVNPAHLEAVTNRENCLRGASGPAQNAAKTHCLRGHPFDASNTHITPRGRECRACWRVRKRNALARRGPIIPIRWQLSKTHCPQNHPYNEINTYRTPAGHRRCRECARLRRG